jgi:hypothetical protein
MIAVILISRRALDNFDLNQKNLRGAAGKSGGIVQFLRESTALPFANQTAKIGRHRKRAATEGGGPLGQTDKAAPAQVERTERMATAPSAIPDVRAAAAD